MSDTGADAVTRYSATGYEHGMTPSRFGSWVRFSAYEHLAAENAALLTKINILSTALEKANTTICDLEDEIAEVEAERDKLRVELEMLRCAVFLKALHYEKDCKCSLPHLLYKILGPMQPCEEVTLRKPIEPKAT